MDVLAAKRVISLVIRKNKTPSLTNPNLFLLKARFCTSTYIKPPYNQDCESSESVASRKYTHREASSKDSEPDTHSPSSSSRASTDNRSFNWKKGTRPTYRYDDVKARVLRASMPHVLTMGWSEEAMIAGARDTGLSPSIVGAFPRKEAALVEFFMDECSEKLADKIESDAEELKNLVPSQQMLKLVRFRLQLQAPYISKWPQALSIQAQPSNFPTSFQQRAALVDDIWHAIRDNRTDTSWYVKHAVLGAIYSTTEIYMLTDTSTEFEDTWAFLDNRIRDAFDLKKSMKEAAYLVEAVGSGMNHSFQGFMKKVFQV